MKKLIKKKQIKLILYIILLFSIFLGFYRIFPYFSVNIPLGYDPWLYRLLFLDYTNNLPNIDFSNFTDRTKSAYPPFLGFLWNILYIIWFNIDNLLSFWLWSFSIISSIFIYLNLKKYSRITAIVWVIIFLISIIQYQAFWWNYYKQIIWIIFMLSSLFLLERKKYFLAFPLIISTFTIHRPTWVYFLLIFIFYKFVNFLLKKDKNYKDIIIIFVWWLFAISIYYPVFHEQILNLLKPLVTTIGETWKSWTFFSKQEFWKYNIFIILVSLYWIYHKINKKDFDFITIWYLVWMLWVWFWLFFYNRFYIFFDIFIILIAAYSFWILYKKNKKIFIILFTIFFILQSSYYYNYVKNNNHPLIGQEEFENIKKINTIVPKNSILMITHKNYSPWIAGYTYKPTIAPWLFKENKWSIKTWKIWWNSDGKKKCELLNDYKNLKKTIYLWIWQRQPKSNLENWKCFEEILVWNGYALLKINFK